MAYSSEEDSDWSSEVEPQPEPIFAGKGAMLKGPYQSRVWHARSKDGVDRLSALPDELLKPIFDHAQVVWNSGRLGKPLNLSRRLLRFSQQQTYESPTIRTWTRFRRFVQTVVAKPELGALVRGLGLACEDAAPAPPFASSEERVAFWKALGGVQHLEISVLSDVLPTMEELDEFGEEERLGKCTFARIAGDFVDWTEPDPVNAPRNLLKLAPNIEKLKLWVDDRVPEGDATAGKGVLEPYPALKHLDIRGHLTQVKHHFAHLLGAFPSLTKLELKELAQGQDLDELVGVLDLPQLEWLHLTATARESGGGGGGYGFYFGFQPPSRGMPPPITAPLTKLNSLKFIQLDVSSEADWLLTLPKSLEHLQAGGPTTLSLPVLTRLFTPGSPDHLPNLHTFHSAFVAPPLQGDNMHGLQLGKARIPYLPVDDQGIPDFGLKEFWKFGPKFPAEGEWTYEAFDRLVRLAEERGIDLGETRFVWPHTCARAKQDELAVRAELKRKWEAGELVWRVDDREVARKIGYQEETGEEPGQIEKGPGPAKGYPKGGKKRKGRR